MQCRYIMIGHVNVDTVSKSKAAQVARAVPEVIHPKDTARDVEI